MCERRHDVVIGVFHATLLDIRHVAVGAGKAALTVDALLEELVARMLRLQNLGVGQRMDIVVEADTVVVSLGVLAGQALVLWEFEVVGAFLEVVLRMALCAHEGAHLLVAGLSDVLAGACPSLVESRTGRLQVHRAGIVAVRASDAVHHLAAPVAPLGGIESVLAFLAHQSRHVGTFASPAGTRLQVFLSVNARRSRAQDFAQVFDTVTVPARRVVVAAESIAVP